MKPLFTVLLICCVNAVIANPVYKKLCEVNRYWSEKKNYEHLTLPSYQGKSETEWIRLHLKLVEQTLRNRSTSSFSVSQKQNRAKALDYLHAYWQAGAFPQNEDYSYRTPIFIDKYDNFCAVGYLVKATGYEHVSRMIAAQTNLAYVHEMNYSELNQWAKEYGFTTDELAWIQPTYPSTPWNNSAKPVGKGTNGNVYELYADSAAGKLYVGGIFSHVDSTITANNIAYATETNGVYTWHDMGAGLNGPVYAIEKYGNDIFAAGSFMLGSTSVAYWNGSSWQAAGCLYGTVKDLIVYNGDLYAAGSFDVCTSISGVNFAKWNGTSWQQLPGITGTINTMEVYDNVLLLGGNFTFGTGEKNVAKWTTSSSFQQYNTSINNEVNDFETYDDTLYAVCKRTAPNDSALIQKLVNNSWQGTFITKHSAQGQPAFKGPVSFNTLCRSGDTLMVAGNFTFTDSLKLMIPPTVTVENSFSLSPRIPMYVTSNWFKVDSAVNKMVVFKGKIIAGGNFDVGYIAFNGTPKPSNRVNGICERVSNFAIMPPLYDSIIVTPACQGDSNGSISVKSSWQLYVFIPGSSRYGDTILRNDLRNLYPGTYTLVLMESGLSYRYKTITVPNHTLDTTVINQGTTLLSTATSVSYQWMECKNGFQPVPGATNASFTPPATGRYALTLTRATSGCSETTACYFVIPTEVNTLYKDYAVKVYPNPVKDVVEITLPQQEKIVSASLSDVTGRVIFTQHWYNKEQIKIDVADISGGIYILKVETLQGEKALIKITKE